MSKEIRIKYKEQGLESDNCVMLPRYKSEKLVGKLLTLIDSAGLPETQDKAIKDLIKQEVYSMFENIDISSNISGEFATAIRMLNMDAHQYAIENDEPCFPMEGDYEIIFTKK